MAETSASLVASDAYSAAKAAMTGRPKVTVRGATLADRSSIVALQRRALRTLGRDYYSDLAIESYLRYTPTLEEYLIADATYYVACLGERLVGCGGWSVRTPAYSVLTRELSPQTQQCLPKVRAMYVHPDFARCGIGRQLVAVIERAIIDAGYEATDVDATLAGVPLYERCGYTAVGETYAALPNGARMKFVCMHKRLVEAPSSQVEPPR